MSSVSPSPSTSSSAISTTNTSNPFAVTNGTPSSSLYLFTFLITVVVLGLISGALLLRGYIIRRRFRLRVAEALARGEPLPTESYGMFGMRSAPPVVPRGKPKKTLGPTPQMYQAEMWRDEKDVGTWGGEEKASDLWDEISPVSVQTYRISPPTPPEEPTPTITIPRPTPREFFRRIVGLHEFTTPNVSSPDGQDTTTASNPSAFRNPEEGEDVVVGVLIAFPSQESGRWEVDEDEEGEVPEVCLGVVDCKIGSGGQ